MTILIYSSISLLRIFSLEPCGLPCFIRVLDSVVMSDCPMSTSFSLEHCELAHESFTLFGSVKCLANDELYIFRTSRSHCLVRGSKWYDDYSSNLCANLWFSSHNVENYDYMNDKPPNESSKFHDNDVNILPSMNS